MQYFFNQVQCGHDYLKIYGTNSDEPLILTGTQSAINITSSISQLNIEFHSNNDNSTNEGFLAKIHYQGTLFKY